MKKIFLHLAILSMIFHFSCSTPDKKENLKSEIQQVTYKYWTNKIKEQTKQTDEIVIIDSIVPITIDTISDLDLLSIKHNYMNLDFERKKEILQLKIDKYKLNAQLNVYENSPDLAEMEMKELNKGQEELTIISEKMEKMEKEMTSNPDSTNFLFYRVTSMLYATENGTTERTVEVANLITKSLKIKELEDIIAK